MGEVGRERVARAGDRIIPGGNAALGSWESWNVILHPEHQELENWRLHEFDRHTDI